MIPDSYAAIKKTGIHPIRYAVELSYFGEIPLSDTPDKYSDKMYADTAKTGHAPVTEDKWFQSI
jgi:hypothetical protein